MDLQIWQNHMGEWITARPGEDGGRNWGRRRLGIRRLARTYNGYIHLIDPKTGSTPVWVDLH